MTHPYRRKDDPRNMVEELLMLLRDLAAAVGLAAFTAVAGFAAGYYTHKMTTPQASDVKVTTPDCGSCRKGVTK